ncbi:hypothetical protein [Calidifontibacter terrae]
MDGLLTTGRAVLVLSPHLDDAWLSTAALLTADVDAEVWTVFAGEPDPATTTPWDLACGFADSHATMTARRQEDLDAFADSGVRLRHLPLLEAAYRDPNTGRSQIAVLEDELRRWAQEHPGGVVALPICAGVHVAPAPWDRLRDRLRRPTAPAPAEAAQASAEAAPAAAPGRTKRLVQRAMHADHQRRRRRAQRRGMAANPDHIAVRDAGLRVASNAGVDVLFWEDLPYLWHARGAEQVGHLRRQGLQLRQCVFAVDTAAKQEHLQHYASQLEVLDPERRRLSRPGHLPESETYWHLLRTETQ